MSSLNKVTLIGNLGRDPEIKALQNGKEVANLSIATSDVWRDKQTGERREKTEWHRIVIWNEHLVKIVKQYVVRGDKIYIEGKLQTRKWTDQNGQDRYSTEVVLSGFDGKIVMLGSPNRNGGGNYGGDSDGGGNDRGTYKHPEGQQQPPSGGGDFDDEIPF